MDDLAEDALFGSFGGESSGTAAAHPPVTPAHAAGSSDTVQQQPPKEQQPALEPRAAGVEPPRFTRGECLLSATFRRISSHDRARLEKLLRELSVPEDEEQSSEASVPEGVVHYCQAYCIDYAGESSAAASAGLPRPQYERAVENMNAVPPVAARTNSNKRQRSQGFQGRYFDAPPASASAAAKPGVLSVELRALLRIGELDPPPFLHRMQNLGYPPGYLGHRRPTADEEATAATLRFLPDKADGGGDSTMEGTALDEAAPPRVPLIDFPGINVPPPPDANWAQWNWRQQIVQPAPLWR